MENDENKKENINFAEIDEKTRTIQKREKMWNEINLLEKGNINKINKISDPDMARKIKEIIWRNS